MVMRRVMVASNRPKGAGYPEGRLPLRASCSVSLADVMRFLDGATHDAHILALARAFMAIDWKRWNRESLAGVADADRIDPDYAVFRLAHAPDGVLRGGERVLIGLDPETSHRLVSGDLPGAAAVALRRLRASGLRPVVRVLTGDATRARRLAASLAFPIRAVDVARCADRVTKPFEATEVSKVTDSMEAS
jgi:CRISPR-associated protein Csx17